MISIILTLVTVFCLQAEPAKSESKNLAEYSIGIGAGLSSGNGVHFAMEVDKNKFHINAGLLFEEQDAVLEYSIGARYLRKIVKGKANDTYLWAGGGLRGSKGDDEFSYYAATGLGLGVEFHFGLPFRLAFDSGYHFGISRENEEDQIFEFTPTFNFFLSYNWQP